jgi:hypothetical protein
MHSAGDEQSRDLSEVVASCREVLPQPYCRYVPSPMAMGIPVSSQLLGSCPAAACTQLPLRLVPLITAAAVTRQLRPLRPAHSVKPRTWAPVSQSPDTFPVS